MGVDMLFILLLALILFGPKRLPEIAREVGKFMAEFKRASNDFKYQLQAEMDKASVPVVTPSDGGGQQSGSSTPTLLPPAILPATLPATPVAAAAPLEAESEHERLMRTARMAYEAQTFSLRPPEPPPVASTVLQSSLQGQRSQDQEAEAAQSSLPFAPGGTDAESRPPSPAEALAARPSTARPSGDPAHESGNSALQNS